MVCAQSGFVEPPQAVTSLRSFAESQTRLPCHYQVDEGEKVVQVTWYKELPDGSTDQIITAHFTDGHTGRLHRGLHTGEIPVVEEVFRSFT